MIEGFLLISLMTRDWNLPHLLVSEISRASYQSPNDFNAEKTTLMVFGNGNVADVVNHYKYLGFMFTTTFSTEVALDDPAVRDK